jgi:hypothetical protein
VAKRWTFLRGGGAGAIASNKLSRRLVRGNFRFFAGLAAGSAGVTPFFLLRMFDTFRFPYLKSLLFSAGLLLGSSVAHAQTAILAAAPAVHGYDFLTVTTAEGVNKTYSFILFSPAFRGKTEISLEPTNTLSGDKYKERLLQNAQLINEQLSALTVAGWELIQVYATSSPANGRSYLFRKAKN